MYSTKKIFIKVANKISTIKSSVATNTQNISTLSGTVTTLGSTVSGLSTSVTALQNKIHISTEDPTSAQGVDGDVWIKYSE